MIDTLKLQSPYVTEADAFRIEQACNRRSEVVISSGEVRWELTAAQLEGSFDHRVSVRIEREEWVTELPSITARLLSTRPAHANVGYVEGRLTASVSPVKHLRPIVSKQPCAPYVVVEGSVHKAMLGHNVYGGPLPPVLSSCWFVDHVGASLGVSLPYAEDWGVQRIDWAEAFELPSFEAVEEYISGLNMAQFPRRKVSRHGNESLFSPGTTTTVKVYHKGPEFHKHDRRRLRDHLEEAELVALQDRANCIMRVETSIKAKKLAADFEGKPLVVQLTQDYLERVHDRETARLLLEANNEMETVRTYREVSRRLHDQYETRLANVLFGTWTQLAAVGQEEVKKTLSQATWYRQRKQLMEAACSWHATDVCISERHSAVPYGFSPVRPDPRRMLGEAEAVKFALGSYNRPELVGIDF